LEGSSSISSGRRARSWSISAATESISMPQPRRGLVDQVDRLVGSWRR
jgi:hypothetical protein